MHKRINKVFTLLKPVGEIFLEHLQRDDKYIEEKSKNDFTTEADKHIELFFGKEILKSFPDDSIIQEEHDNIIGKSEYSWVIDPIDGTNNYIRKIPDARIQIALIRGVKIIWGAIYNPIGKEIYIGELGKGAKKITLGSNKRVDLHVSKNPFEKSFVIYTAGVAKGDGQSKGIFNALLGNIGSLRIYGAASIAFELIASGRADCFICNIAKPVDMAAGSLIVRESGGKSLNFNGEDWTLDMKDVLVANDTNYSDFLDIVKPRKGLSAA